VVRTPPHGQYRTIDGNGAQETLADGVLPSTRKSPKRDSPSFSIDQVAADRRLLGAARF
jgi:hypothetical protein